MKNWKRLLSTVLAAALFMTQPGGVTFAGAVSRGASAAADAVSTAAQYMAEALQNVMIPLPTGAVVDVYKRQILRTDSGYHPDNAYCV